MIGERIKERRKALQLTQVALAQEVGISQSYLSELETGKITEIGSQALRPLAKALQVSSDWLLDLTPISS